MRFEKWHALGNAYVLVAQPDAGMLTPDRVRRLCDSSTGIGGDGVIEVLTHDESRAEIAIWNPDGSTAEMSGNGTRIAAAWLLRDGDHEEAEVETAGRRVRSTVGFLVVASAAGRAAAMRVPFADISAIEPSGFQIAISAGDSSVHRTSMTPSPPLPCSNTQSTTRSASTSQRGLATRGTRYRAHATSRIASRGGVRRHSAARHDVRGDRLRVAFGVEQDDARMRPSTSPGTWHSVASGSRRARGPSPGGASRARGAPTSSPRFATALRERGPDFVDYAGGEHPAGSIPDPTVELDLRRTSPTTRVGRRVRRPEPIGGTGERGTDSANASARTRR